MKQAYTSDDIVVLSDRDHVRMRLSMYAGSTSPTTYNLPFFRESSIEIVPTTFVFATMRIWQEIVDNSCDEFSQITISSKTLTIECKPDEGVYSVSDNGRGIPIDLHATGKPTPEVVFGSLRSGRNFVEGKTVGTVGQNGIGSSMTCFCSERFDVEICRDKKKYTQSFRDGALDISTPEIKRHLKPHTGTKVSYKLDPTVVKDVTLPADVLRNNAIAIAFNNPDVLVHYNGEPFQYKNGLEDVVKQISKNYFKFGISGFEFFVIFDQNIGADEQIFTWVNSSLLYDGGMCNTQFLNAFVDATTEHLKRDAKKLGAEVTKNDVRHNLLILGALKVSDPIYDSQSKTRLIGPNLRKELNDIVASNWTQFTKKHKVWLEAVLERANERHHKTANKKASDEFKKSLRKKVPGLLDATGRDRSKCKLFVCEGLSAASSLVEVRDVATMGSFPVGGKINNVYGATIAQVLRMGKLTDVLASIGLVPGLAAQRHELRFGSVVIASDADSDGDDIMTTLVCLFYQFWKELFDPKYKPYFYRLIAPNVVAVKGTKRVHFTTKHEYETQRDKYKGWSISYLKGLGSMEQADWEIIINDERFYLPIVDDGKMATVLELLFGDSVESRRDWLSNKEQT